MSISFSSGERIRDLVESSVEMLLYSSKAYMSICCKSFRSIHVSLVGVFIF